MERLGQLASRKREILYCESATYLALPIANSFFAPRNGKP